MNEQKIARNEVCVICGKENPTVSVRLSEKSLKKYKIFSEGIAGSIVCIECYPMEG